MRIEKVTGRQIFDSRGNPTVEAEVYLANGIIGRASVPSGASKGSKEVCELRDNNKNYLGRGVQIAVGHVNNEINKELAGHLIPNQEELDGLLCALDGTEDKSRLGANALLAVSLAGARAAALANQQPLYRYLNNGQEPCMPIPLVNVLNGGVHANNNLDIQEFMLVPAGALTFTMAIQMVMEVFHSLKTLLQQQGFSTAVGDEGGFAPQLQSNRHALDLLAMAIEHAGYTLGKEIFLALDVAASELWQNGNYYLAAEKKIYHAEELINFYKELVASYNIVSIEDGLHENDWQGWQKLTASLGSVIQLIGDDLFVTSTKLLQQGIDQNVANSILIKYNQIGTLTEAKQAISLAQQHNYGCVISHRSGETEDTFIADLAVATGCGQIKTGSLCRSERVAKYNQLLRIEEQTNLKYAKNIKYRK